MSFPTMTPCPDDKASSTFFVSGCEQMNTEFFDEFLTFNHETDTTLDYTSLPPATYLDISTSESNSLGTSLSLTDDDTKQSFEHNELNSSPYSLSAQDQFYNGLMGRASVSDTELLSLEDICLESTHIPRDAKYLQTSLPPSPSATAAAVARKRARMQEVYSKPLRRATSFDKALLHSPPIRKRTCSPTRTDTTQQSHETKAWEQKLHEDALKFDFNFSFAESSRAFTPPNTCKVSDILPSLIRTPLKPAISFTNPIPTEKSTSSASYATPLNTPALDHSKSRASSGQFSSGPLFPVTPQSQNASGSWGTLPGSAPVATFGPSLFPEMDEPIWWNHASTAKMAQPSPSLFHNSQRATKNLTVAMQLHNGISYGASDNMSFDSASMTSGGLMIQMPAHSHPSHMVTPPMLNHPQHQRGYYSPDSSRPRLHRRATHQQYAPESKRHYLPQPRHTPPDPYHSTTSRKTHPRSTSSESESSSSKSPSSTYNARKCRTPNSRSRKQSIARTPTPGNGASSLVDFVNYTPQDSKKILTGVAPSGSSKTKARREKEAMDKRRKMSEAARRAVRAAGGDESMLIQEEGLFICS